MGYYIKREEQVIQKSFFYKSTNFVQKSRLKDILADNL